MSFLGGGMARAGAGFASLNDILVPLFGVMWGVLLLSERPRRKPSSAC